MRILLPTKYFERVSGGGECRCGRHSYTTSFGGRVSQPMFVWSKYYWFDSIMRCIEKCCHSNSPSAIDRQYKFNDGIYNCP